MARIKTSATTTRCWNIFTSLAFSRTGGSYRRLQRQLGEKIAGLIAREDPWCRGILLLGLDAPSDRLRAGFAEAAGHPIIKGFAVGRTIFGQPSRRWMAGELSDEALIGEVKQNYLRLIDYWREARG